MHAQENFHAEAKDQRASQNNKKQNGEEGSQRNERKGLHSFFAQKHKPYSQYRNDARTNESTRPSLPHTSLMQRLRKIFLKTMPTKIRRKQNDISGK
mmetsp:Transcript_13855/g.27616  ORF Transcript_13855/g.27616 Transcript_13855/m.27616 type:complete len:97 (+) Transcript_13855:532-822(+)